MRSLPVLIILRLGVAVGGGGTRAALCCFAALNGGLDCITRARGSGPCAEQGASFASFVLV